MKFLITLLAVFSFILWWGGFTFYAAFVISTGQKVLGDHVMMGFITEQVASKINYAALIACLLSFLNEWVRGGMKARLMRSFVVICLSVMLGLVIALFILYPFLQDLLDHQAHKEVDHDKFYLLHRIYLIISSALWVNGIVFIILSVNKYSSALRGNVAEKD
ncbi:MAG TPA: hypothetical protein VK806_00680 [Bacteroidia bacterium]|jgi:hypothetical protein|nr:hypothetical protein [Bacteroidia bacterium]